MANYSKILMMSDFLDTFHIKQRKTVYDMIKRDGLPSLKIGGLRCFHLDEVIDWGKKRGLVLVNKQ